MADSPSHYKVVLVFDLKPGMAEEELRRSHDAESFPRRLSAQPGFNGMELVKISEDQTMSVQTWASPEAWWAALEIVKSEPDGARDEDDREPILVSRQFFGGSVLETLSPAGQSASTR